MPTTAKGSTLIDATSFVGEDDLAITRQQTSLADVVVLLAHRKKLVFSIAIAVTLATAASVPFLSDSFTAEASILPPQQQQSSLAAFTSGALGSLAISGAASQLGLKNPADLYIGILKSHTISDDMISRFHLQEVYKEPYISDARKELLKHTSFTSGRDSLLLISVEDHDPKRAAAMANAFIDELYKQNSRFAITDASQRRLFFQQQLSKEKDALSNAEVALKDTQGSTGLLAPTGQAEVLIRSAAQLRAEIAMREVSLQAMRSYATDENSQIQVLKSEISTMRSQLAKLGSKGEEGGGLAQSAGALPSATLAYVRKLRDVKYHETLYELLSKQYESALIDEAKQAPVIQVVDHANVPDKSSGPRRFRLILISVFVGLIVGSFYVLAVHHVRSLFAVQDQSRHQASSGL